MKDSSFSWKEVAISLVTLHYGLGFLVGSGESIYLYGPQGILYALSTAFGIFSLLFIYKFYLKRKYPIWTLMGRRYGKSVKESILFLSSIWMIGVVASQVQGGASVLQTFGVQQGVAIVVLAIIITLLSLINLRRLVKLFSFMLIFSSLSLLFVLNYIGIEWIPKSIGQILNHRPAFSSIEILNVTMPTVLVTFIGMDFHQFVVRSKNANAAVKGIVVAMLMLLAISTILLSVVNGAIESGLLFNIDSSRQVISLLLHNFGAGFSPIVSIVLSLPIILVAIGSGSGVNRIVNKCMTESKTLPSFLRKKPNVFFLVFFFVLAISFSGDSVVGLIVAFYAIYVGSVFIPFIASIFDEKFILNLSRKSMRYAIYISVFFSLLVYLYSFVPGSYIKENKSAIMVIVGFIASLLILSVENWHVIKKCFKRINKYRPYMSIRIGIKPRM